MSKEYIKAQTPLPAYFPYPKFLLQISLSHTARLTYVLLLDRMTLSQKNGWVDVQGRAYVLYPLAGLAEDLQSSISSVTRALRELEAARLIERRSNGFSKPNQVFLSFPSTAQKCTVEMVKNEQPDCSKVSNTIAQNCTPNQINKNNLRWNKINRTKEAYTRYKALDAQYAKEQDALEIEIAELEKAVTGYEQSQKSAEKFIALIDKYENFDTLTNTMLNEFVEKILVHERARKGSQDTTQEIEIYFNFLGRYIPPSLQPVPLTPEEQEELRKKEERKDRLHQNYLKRKASGAQKRYEDKIKAKKKAEMDAKKALIRAEDMKKGVFSTIGQLPKEEPRKGSIAASAAV